MNLLIVGGLLAFAIVAILVAVLLGVGDQRAQNARANGYAAAQSPVAVPVSAPAPVTPVAPVATATPVATPVPTPEQQAQVSRTYRKTVPLSPELSTSLPQEKPAQVSQPLASQHSTSLPRVEQEELPFYSLNGQVHELVHELHSLHQQAWELEQRLLSLTELLDRVDRTDTAVDHHLGIDEEVTQEQFSPEAL